MNKELDWRELKKELFDPLPKQRSNLTLNRTDVFSLTQENSSRKVRVNSTNKKSDIFDHSTPLKVLFAILIN
jgi:hypothetical protein